MQIPNWKESYNYSHQGIRCVMFWKNEKLNMSKYKKSYAIEFIPSSLGSWIYFWTSVLLTWMTYNTAAHDGQISLPATIDVIFILLSFFLKKLDNEDCL
jgi:hypothetical protein